MMSAGTPCPYEGKIGDEAKQQWELNTDKIPEDSTQFKKKVKTSYKTKKTITKTFTIDKPTVTQNGRGTQ